MTQQAPPWPQNPAHGNGTCEQCGEPCAVCGPRWCPSCYYVDNVPRDRVINPKERNPRYADDRQCPTQTRQ